MANETMDKIRLLRNRLKQIGDELGLDMRGFMLVPAEDDDSPDMAQAMFVVRSEAIKGEKDADDALLDEQFRAITANIDLDGTPDDDDIKDDLRKWMEDGEA